jgi:hypothetical protein
VKSSLTHPRCFQPQALKFLLQGDEFGLQISRQWNSDKHSHRSFFLPADETGIS